jgi:hypothetical protein
MVSMAEVPDRVSDPTLAELLRRLVPAYQPERVYLFGHHTRLDAEVAGVRCVGLNKVAMPGNLVAVELEAHGRGWSLLGEWPTRP